MAHAVAAADEWSAAGDTSEATRAEEVRGVALQSWGCWLHWIPTVKEDHEATAKKSKMEEGSRRGIMSRAQKWADKDPDEVTRRQLQDMIERNDEQALRQAFGDRLAFGTAGLRGVMGVGPNNMNVREMWRRILELDERSLRVAQRPLPHLSNSAC